EDGIRDSSVTGVQTCALPIFDAISSGAVMQAYEERFLFLLLLLRQPRARLIYVTSQTILPSVIDYYLGLLPGVIPSHARQRLFQIGRASCRERCTVSLGEDAI